jgi:hypothetical protein
LRGVAHEDAPMRARTAPVRGMYEGLAAPVDARRECTEGRRGFGKGSARGRPHYMALGDRRDSDRSGACGATEKRTPEAAVERWGVGGAPEDLPTRVTPGGEHQWTNGADRLRGLTVPRRYSALLPSAYGMQPGHQIKCSISSRSQPRS